MIKVLGFAFHIGRLINIIPLLRWSSGLSYLKILKGFDMSCLQYPGDRVPREYSTLLANFKFRLPLILASRGRNWRERILNP